LEGETAAEGPNQLSGALIQFEFEGRRIGTEVIGGTAFRRRRRQPKGAPTCRFTRLNPRDSTSPQAQNHTIVLPLAQPARQSHRRTGLFAISAGLENRPYDIIICLSKLDDRGGCGQGKSSKCAIITYGGHR